MRSGSVCRVAHAAGVLAGALLACAALLARAAEPAASGIVTAILDGDTIRVQLPEGPAVVRLAHVDAPEYRQPGGPEARQALHAHLIGAAVRLDVVSRRPDEWIVAVVWREDENVNGWLVKQGHAWAYRQYASDPGYCVWENAARALRRGL